MKSNPILNVFQSIRTRLLGILLGISLITVIILATVAIVAAQRQGSNAQARSAETLTDQATTYLTQITASSAKENDLILGRLKLDLKKAASYLANVYENPDAFQGQDYWSVENNIFQGPDGQYINEKSEPGSAYLPATSELNEVSQLDLEASSYLDFLFPTILENNPSIGAAYFATPTDMTRYYPNIELGLIVGADFRASTRPWYVASMPDVNPSREPLFINPYVDATGLGLVTTAAIPVYDSQGQMLGVIGFDVTLKEMADNIEETRVLQSGYFFLIDDRGKALALPDEGHQDILGTPPQEGEETPDLSTTETSFAAVITAMMNGESGMNEIDVEGRKLYVAYAPLESAGWSLGTVVEESEILGEVGKLSQDLQAETNSLIITTILPVTLGLIVVSIVASVLFANNLSTPLMQLAEAARRIKEGEWDAPIPKVPTVEVRSLAEAFETMASKLHENVEQLEARVAERTKTLERRSTQIQVAAEVARDASSSRQLDVLLTRSVNLVRDRFGFYHAGIFLLDETGEYAVLKAATGGAGEEMLNKNHKLQVGAVGMVGYAAGTGTPRISMDVGTDTVHYKNPLLPDTRSELALPLKVGHKVIGVIDVQSREENAFEQEDLAVLQIMADQLTVAIENARLFEEAQASIEQLRAIYHQIDQQAWKRVGEMHDLVGYRYDRGSLSPLYVVEEGQDAPVSLPLLVRGEVIGALDVWPSTGAWSAEEVIWLQSVGDRVSQAMESARLFEEAQSRAAREQTLNQLVAGFARSLDFDTLLQSAVRELGQLPNVSEVSIHVGAGQAAPGNGKEESKR